jgi:predicted permease
MKPNEVLRRAFFFLRRNRMAEDLEEEMRLHSELRAAKLRRQGVAPEQASALARRQFGNKTSLKESAWETWSFLSIEKLWRDLKFAGRLLRKNPGFTFIAVSTLALGIGANTAVFSVVDAVLLRPLPYPSPERLGSLATYYKAPSQQGMFTDQDGKTWELMRDNAQAVDSALFSDMAATVNLAAQGHVQYVQQQRAGSGFFRVLGVEPLFGREFTRQEDKPNGSAVAVVSYGLWKRALHGDRSLLNHTISLRGEPYLVVGVMPADFKTAALADVWTPLRPSTEGEGGGANYQIVTRLKSGATWAQATSEVEAIGVQRTRSMRFDPGESLRITLLPLQKALSEQIRTPVLLLWCAVGVVLLICCINIAGLVLARGAGRRHEIATRMALGGGQAQVVRQLLVESFLLSLLAGVSGLAIGYAGIVGLRIAARESLNLWQYIGLDSRVFVVTCAVTVFTTMLFGLYPAFQASRVDLRAGLIEQGGRAVAGGKNLWPQRLMIVGEVALGVTLLVAAGLLLRSFLLLRNQQPGFDAKHVVSATLPLQDARYQTSQKMNQLFTLALSRIRSSPGVQRAAVTMSLPYQRGLNTMFKFPGAPGKDTTLTYVTPEYFDVLRIPLLSGRTFSDLDGPHSSKVTIVNQTFVRMYSGGKPLVGRTILNGNTSSEIVGVVGDVPMKGSLMGYAPVTSIPMMFIPAAQLTDGSVPMLNTWFPPSVAVRSSAPVRDTVAAMRGAMQSVDSLLPFSEFRGIDEIRSATLAQQRFQAVLMAALAALALLLAAIGIYGLIAQSVMERTRELGIRLALGATAWQAVKSAALPGVAIATVGCLLGIVGAFGIVRLMRNLIWGVSATDARTFLGTAALLLLVAVIASFAAAMRILRMNSVEILRNE